MFNLS